MCSYSLFVLPHQDVDTALLKLLAETRSPSLTDIVSTSEPFFAVSECTAMLEQNKVKCRTARLVLQFLVHIPTIPSCDRLDVCLCVTDT